MIRFERGPYNEILPPPLIGDVSPEEAYKRLYAFSLSKGHKLDKPEMDEDRAVLYNLGGVFVHQMRLREVIGGKAESAVEIALRDAVWRGERLSLRPLGLEDKVFKTFAPVLERLGMNDWLVGVPGEEQVIPLMEVSTAVVVEKAQEIYVGWRNDESQAGKVQSP
jgi:hypothetical protein